MEILLNWNFEKNFNTKFFFSLLDMKFKNISAFCFLDWTWCISSIGVMGVLAIGNKHFLSSSGNTNKAFLPINSCHLLLSFIFQFFIFQLFQYCQKHVYKDLTINAPLSAQSNDFLPPYNSNISNHQKFITAH